jgi:hypothetical protein
MAEQRGGAVEWSRRRTREVPQGATARGGHDWEQAMAMSQPLVERLGQPESCYQVGGWTRLPGEQASRPRSIILQSSHVGT